ncbi:PilZ domain-containing protein [Neorhizobium sp. JUb45]|uniref:PilZ domain-containing protein n=1 Tax=unclassified Neorhizobium TaxID=2629175 RepID=UPI00104D52B9|nr:PilZ domain-containing protein [Neorhizobium sp. JUb45]
MEIKPVQERKFPRSRAFLGAKILFNDGHSSYDCIIKELSEGGAQIKVENALAVPQQFNLLFSDGRNFDCEVRWRRINAIGVEFQKG